MDKLMRLDELAEQITKLDKQANALRDEWRDVRDVWRNESLSEFYISHPIEIMTKGDKLLMIPQAKKKIPDRYYPHWFEDEYMYIYSLWWDKPGILYLVGKKEHIGLIQYGHDLVWEMRQAYLESMKEERA